MIARRTLLLASVAAPMLGACATTGASPHADLPHDPHSYARPNQARVTHVSLDLAADFQRKVLRGTAILDIMARPDVSQIILDTRGLNISSVRREGGEARWSIGVSDPILGAPLSVEIEPTTRRLTIAYETAPDAAALLWLAPEQTSGAHPFLFSQGQAILTRTWIPTQDSPGVRQTYVARIVAPPALQVVMSAEKLTPNGEAAPDGRAFRFRMPHAIPPYLIAIAIGDLSFQSLGPHTGVYAEPAVLERAAYEFADTERMLNAAEALYGPYRWGRYDILVLPPAFPYGGMENPTLTFATPTVLAGDRSLVSLIAHELAHSWSGNLVTNATWDDFWLNESFTTYIEGRIVEVLYGREEADMTHVLAWADIQKALAEEPASSTVLTAHFENPDDPVSAIVYEKGAALLRLIEAEVGRARFDAYLRSYFERYRFQPITTAAFAADIRVNLFHGDAALEQRIQLDAWTGQPGLPSNAVPPRSEALDRVDAAAAAFAGGGSLSDAPWPSWGTLQRQRFLRRLPLALNSAQLGALEQGFALNQTGNSEILFDWLTIAVRHRYQPAVPALERFLLAQGRWKFVFPLYRDLMRQGEWGALIARRTYALARPMYHSVSQTAIDTVVTN